jgi:hypothetical protein
MTVLHYGTDDAWRIALRRTDRLADLKGTFGSFTAPRTRIPDQVAFRLTLPGGETIAAQYWSAGLSAGTSYVAGSDGEFYLIPSKDLSAS